MRFVAALFFLLLALKSVGQLKQVPIVHSASAKKKTIQARMQSTLPLPLPFWDDFSFNGASGKGPGESYPSDSLWQFHHSVWVNNGMGIAPPSVNVATFDGLDSLGFPYNVTTPTAKGPADHMLSRPLLMANINPALRDSVFIFFYYQWKGRGEGPDPGDDFTLSFLNDAGGWDVIWKDTVKNHVDSIFLPVKIYITDAKYYHNAFQFRFQNIARLSGPFDTWHLDYVYVSNGKSKYLPQTGYKDFPDRAVVSPISSPFLQYQSIPLKHLRSTGKSALTYPALSVNNLRADKTPTGNGPEPVNVACHLSVLNRVNNAIASQTLALDSVPVQSIFFQQPTTYTYDSLLRLSLIDPKSDSTVLTYLSNINRSDNAVKISIKQGDYDTAVYKGIDFRHNDTIRTSYTLRNYYAYDDGGAEFAVTLTQPGSYLAYQFDLMYNQPDTLVAVDIYFPHDGDESDQTIQLMVWDTLTTSITNILVQQSLAVTRTVNNQFTRVKLGQAALVKNKFFVGWKQNTDATIGVGFDKNSNSGSKIFSNTAGVWIQNTVLKGNMMIHPVFGNGSVQTVTGVDPPVGSPYPNPNHGVFYLPVSTTAVQVMDGMGRPITFAQELMSDKLQISLQQNNPGLHIVRYQVGTRTITFKLMVAQ